MEVKANIKGVCITQNKESDNTIKWDKIPYSYINMGKGVKGDVVICNYAGKIKIYMKCPNCGVAAFSGKHKVIYQNGMVNVTPSIQTVCCGWHGYLKDNLFKEC